MQAKNGARSGWGELSFIPIFRDAIFPEADAGDIETAKVEEWEFACRSLRGLVSINQAQSDLEGAWDIAGLILGFGLDTHNGTISAPSSKIEGRACLF